MVQPQLLGRLLLQFDPQAQHVPEDLSAAVLTPDGNLWVASDEHGAFERLSPSNQRIFGSHQRFLVSDLLGQPTEGEMDIEAIDYQDGFLWLVGSHSSVRKKPKKQGAAKDLDRLATIEHQPSRFLLARLPLPEDLPAQGAESPSPQGRARPARVRHAHHPHGVNTLVELLRKDPHLGPFLAPISPDDPNGPLAIPSKDNGLDIEGLTVHGDRVFLGLRGPVLRGFAVLLQLEVEDTGDGFLEPRVRKKGSSFHKHFLDLDGLGIREVCRQGDDLLILAGPTLPLDGTIRLYRLRNGLALGEDSIHHQGKDGGLEPLFDIPRSEKHDHAEGVSLFSWFEPDDSVLVVYDSPSERRRVGPSGVLADVFRL